MSWSGFTDNRFSRISPGSMFQIHRCPDGFPSYGVGEQASTDCNAGLILGIAAFGRSQQAKVRRILVEPKWEMDATGTGSHWWGYMSMQMSEVTFSQLISDMLDIMPLDLHKVETLEVETLIVHGLQVLHDLMEVKLSDDLHPPFCCDE